MADTCAASAAPVGWSKATVAETVMPNLAMTAFLSSTAPSESNPAWTVAPFYSLPTHLEYHMISYIAQNIHSAREARC